MLRVAWIQPAKLSLLLRLWCPWWKSNKIDTLRWGLFVHRAGLEKKAVVIIIIPARSCWGDMWVNLIELWPVRCWVMGSGPLCLRRPDLICFAKHWCRDVRLNVMKTPGCLLLKTQVYSTLALSAFESQIGNVLFLPLFWSNTLASLWGTTSEGSTWVVIQWSGHVSRLLRVFSSFGDRESRMCSKLVHSDSLLRFLIET